MRAHEFLMESVHSVVTSLDRGDSLASLNIKDASLHVPFCEGCQSCLRFCDLGWHYQFVALLVWPLLPGYIPQFGMVLVSLGRGLALIGYLDGLLLWGRLPWS